MLAQSKRWNSVYFTRQPLVIRLLSSIRRKIPNLPVYHIDTDPLGMFSGNLSLFQFAPSLKHIHLKRVWWQAVIPLTAPNLISFSDDQTDDAERLRSMYLDIIRASPCLETFDIQHQCRALPVVTPRIVHSALQILTVCEAAFISSPEFPALKSIEICCHPISRGDRQTAPDVLLALRDLIWCLVLFSHSSDDLGYHPPKPYPFHPRTMPIAYRPQLLLKTVLPLFHTWKSSSYSAAPLTK
ncbi:hypothetical protein DFS33DRAFT_630738 [Desarmillaria ectypa]|nr:hypothetical protein DFS33DRAFT_630738 [Desarmillaria ectypa]